MVRSVTSKLLVVAIAACVAPGVLAQDHSGGEAVAAPRRLRLAVGVDSRSYWDYFYFYPGGYSETSGSSFGLALEGAYALVAGDRLELSVGVGLAAGTGSCDFAGSGVTGGSEDAATVHAELFGEAGFRLVPRFALLGRLGVAYTAIGHDSADESLTSVELGLGARFALQEWLAVAAIYQFDVGARDGTTDAGVTSADPTLQNSDDEALQLRAVFSF